MKIFDFALKMEKDNEQLYRELSAKTTDPNLSKVLTMLAEDEVKHYQIINNLMSQTEKISEMGSSTLDQLKNVFQQISDDKEEIVIDKSQLDIYKTAQDLEKKSMDFYNERAKEADNEKQRKFFSILAKEEEKHYLILDNLIIHVDRPQTWVEFAEFFPMEEY